MHANEILTQLNELDEHSKIEAKRSSQIGRSLMETICAFSNEPSLGGGHIILGVRAETDSFWPTYVVEGIDDPDKLQLEIASNCRNMFNRPIRPQMTVETVGEKRVVVVFVQEVPPGDKPVYFEREGLPHGAYRRVGSSDQRCTDDDLMIFAHDRHGVSYDASVLPDAVLDDIDPQAVKFYRGMRKKASPDAEELTWDDDDLLRGLSCAKRENGALKPTVAGVLLFGTRLALRRLFPTMRIDYIRMDGTEWASNPADPDRRFDAVEIRDPLIRAIPRAVAAILDDIPKAFRLPTGMLQRKEVPAIPDRVIREAIVNAVMHRTYRDHGPIQIIRYSNRLEIRNPGFSLVSEDRLGEPGSELRNPNIAAVLHELRVAETKGSGIRVMRDTMKQAHLSPPLLESDRSGNRFTLFLLFHHFLGKDDLEWLKNFEGISDDDAQALITAREIGAINNAAYRNITGADTLTASGRLRALRKSGLLEKKGTSADTYYVPTKKLMSPKPQGLTPNPQGSMLQPEGFRPDPSKDEYALEPLPKKIQALVDRLPNKASERVMSRLILSLCAWRDLKSSEIAEYCHRNVDYLRSTHIARLLDRKLLGITTSSQSDPKLRYRILPSGIEWLKKNP